MTSSYASRTTTTGGASSNSASSTTSKTDSDIPDWKRSMMERAAARQREVAEAQEAVDRVNRNLGGFVPGTTLHSSYTRSNYTDDNREASKKKDDICVLRTNCNLVN